MNKEEEEAALKALHALLREFDANRGMAAMVCSRPVELMPENEAKRLIDGFCTSTNLRVLSESQGKFEKAKELMALEPTDRQKVDRAIVTLSKLSEYFGVFVEGSIELDELRSKVRALVSVPVPEDKEGLIHSLSHLIETLHYLAEQPFLSKDPWDRLIDAVQLYDASIRTRDICTALQQMTGQGATQAHGIATDETRCLCEEALEVLEDCFKENILDQKAAECFQKVAITLQDIWKNKE